MKRLFLLVVAILLLLFVFPASAYEDSSLLSRGKTYNIITLPSIAYPDDESYKLTDGIFAELIDGHYYKGSDYVGFNRTTHDRNGDFIIILDLGTEYDNIGAFAVNYLVETNAGIYAPVKITAFIADSYNGVYKQVDSTEINASTEKNTTMSDKVSIVSESPITGRFVKFAIKHSPRFESASERRMITPGWMFVDEIEVFSTDDVPVTADNTLIAISIFVFVAFAAAWLGLKCKRA